MARASSSTPAAAPGSGDCTHHTGGRRRAEHQPAEPGLVGPEGALGDAVAQGVSGGKQRVHHHDRGASGQEGDEEALHGPGQASGVTAESALCHLEHEQGHGDGPGDGGHHPEDGREPGPAQADRRRLVHLRP